MEKFAVTNDINERFNKVEERFSNYLKSEIFEKQKEKMEEGLKIWKDNINNFNIDNSRFKKIINRFDEILLGMFIIYYTFKYAIFYYRKSIQTSN